MSEFKITDIPTQKRSGFWVELAEACVKQIDSGKGIEFSYDKTFHPSGALGTFGKKYGCKFHSRKIGGGKYIAWAERVES